jgi:hypothetical protein
MLLREKVYTSADAAAINNHYLDCISKRVKELRLCYPEVEDLPLEYVA